MGCMQSLVCAFIYICGANECVVVWCFVHNCDGEMLSDFSNVSYKCVFVCIFVRTISDVVFAHPFLLCQ